MNFDALYSKDGCLKNGKELYQEAFDRLTNEEKVEILKQLDPSK